MLSKGEIVAQSKSAYNQWKDKWRKHATLHSKFPQKNLSDFVGKGVGKACLLIANGASFEREIETIKKYQDNVDIVVCDKSLVAALDHGLKPKFCIVCDANVSFTEYAEKHKDKLKDIILFINVCANSDWTHKAIWKDIYFFVNEDVLESEKEFCQLSGCPNKIPAATNVSGAMLVFLTQSNNRGANNFFGYDKYLLIGFDYCWKANGSYYAFNYSGAGKRNYMRHMMCVDVAGDIAYTSSNLLFSAKWLKDYLSVFKLPVINCTKDTILTCSHFGKLEEQMQYEGKKIGVQVNLKLKERKGLTDKVKELDEELTNIFKNQKLMFFQTI